MLPMPMPSLHEAARRAGGNSEESDGYIIAENLKRTEIPRSADIRQSELVPFDWLYPSGSV